MGVAPLGAVYRKKICITRILLSNTVIEHPEVEKSVPNEMHTQILPATRVHGLQVP